jgi:hypothetical protein
MKKLLLAFSLASIAASPAFATGGLVCRTAGPRPIELYAVISHTAGSGIVSARLLDNGRAVPVSAAQWWLDGSELRLLLVDPNAMRRELLIKAHKNGRYYDGSVWRAAQRRWVRCREG